MSDQDVRGQGGVRVEFRLLGPLEVRRAGKPVELGGPRQRAVLTFLLLHANDLVSAGGLVEAVWDSPPAAPESNLRTYVAGLRKAFGPEDGRLVTHPGRGYQLVVEQGELDLDLLADLDNRADQAVRARDFTMAERVLCQALGLWRGTAAANHDSGPALRAELIRLEEQRLVLVERHAEARIELGRFDDVIGDLRREVVAHPLREELWAWLMVALERSGHRADALEVFATARQRLVDDLGIEPGPRLRQLQRQVLEGVQTTGRGAHRQLPMDIAEFTGRETELRKLRRLVESRPPTAVVISAIEGMAGVGKTRLAVHAAHQLADRFDEVQLWSDLRGFDPHEQPADPAAVLESFLRLLGVAGGEIPYGLEERAALYRDRLAGKRALVLLDNAAGEEQVRPLLPGSPSCLVLITSRRSLLNLDGAQPLFLDVFTPEEAVVLMGRIAGHDRIAAEPEAAARVAELCGHLPIAVSLAAKRLHSRPQWTVADLVGRLERGSRGLTRLSTVFDLSYEALPDEQRRVFRLLGLHLGDDFTADSAAALVGLPPSEVDDRLEELLDEHLLQQHTQGRYRFHDLLRAYAAEQAAVEEPAEEQRAAIRRVLDWYLHTARNADEHLNAQRRIELDALASLVTPRSFTDHHGALTWCDTERANLVAGVTYAADHDLPEHTWLLTWVLWDFFNLRKHWQDWISTHEIALDTARGAGDQVAEGRTLITLAIGLRELQRFDEAFEHYRESLAIWRALDDREREEVTLNNMGIAYFSLERFDEALRCYRESLGIARALGKRHSEGVTLNNIGLLYVELGQLDRAVQCYRDALVIRAEVDDPYSEGIVLNNLGEAYRGMLRFPEAVVEIGRALEIFRRIGDRYGTAEALNNLGQALIGTEDREGAEKCWHEALGIFAELGDPKVAEVQALLKS
jgi:DNA-binding SARP family transcriptional activator/Tfp pilus assembly protein PilF